MSDRFSPSHDTMSTSQIPTPHPLSQCSCSPPQTDDEEAKSTVDVSINTFVSSQSKSLTPSHAQFRSGATTESGLFPKVPTPEGAQRPPVEPNDEMKSTSEVKHDQRSDESLRTPNVYINGLPPHFPDESLYLMTRDFGHVLSVRTFTRCVGEKMSGYGFVL